MSCAVSSWYLHQTKDFDTLSIEILRLHLFQYFSDPSQVHTNRSGMVLSCNETLDREAIPSALHMLHNPPTCLWEVAKRWKFCRKCVDSTLTANDILSSRAGLASLWRILEVGRDLNPDLERLEIGRAGGLETTCDLGRRGSSSSLSVSSVK